MSSETKQAQAIVEHGEFRIPALDRPLTASEVRDQVNLIQQVMKAVMEENVHYGVIPGTKKPTLYKAGSEKLLSTFRIAVEPIIEDLSTEDEARFRVLARGQDMGTARFLGSGVGECSSSEDKYQWRRVVCNEEFDDTPETRRREKWVNPSNSKPYKIKQVRMNMPDVRNTVLKMAKKRAQVDLTLTVTAASDIFEQDIEDMPEEALEHREGHAEAGTAPTVAQPQRKSQQGQPQAWPAQGVPAKPNSARTITENQHKRLWAIAHSVGWREEEVKRFIFEHYGFQHTSEVTMDKYDAVISDLQQGTATA